jgi:hypothetical protein
MATCPGARSVLKREELCIHAGELPELPGNQWRCLSRDLVTRAVATGPGTKPSVPVWLDLDTAHLAPIGQRSKQTTGTAFGLLPGPRRLARPGLNRRVAAPDWAACTAR